MSLWRSYNDLHRDVLGCTWSHNKHERQTHFMNPNGSIIRLHDVVNMWSQIMLLKTGWVKVILFLKSSCLGILGYSHVTVKILEISGYILQCFFEFFSPKDFKQNSL